MKRILLGTTMLIGAASIAAAAHADTPRITLGGTSDFQLGYVNEDRSAGTSSTDANFRGGAFRTETEINVKVDAKTDGGLGYGGQIDLATSGHADQDNNTDQVNRSWLYMSGSWGRAEMGTTYGVNSTMELGAESIARATGGIDGDWTYFMTGTTGRVIATPDLILDYGNTSGSGAVQFGDESQEGINKVNYYTPKFAGFQAGASFLFDTLGTSRGIISARGDNNTNQAENVFLGALTWEGKFSNVGLAAAATGEWGSAESALQNDLRTWNVGAQADFMGFSVAGSYGNLGDSLQTKTTASDDASYYTLGAAYETGPFGVSVTWLDSEVETAAATTNEFNNLSVGVDYKLAPGFTPYAEVSFIEVDIAGGTTNDNDATVFIAGSTLSF